MKIRILADPDCVRYREFKEEPGDDWGNIGYEVDVDDATLDSWREVIDAYRIVQGQMCAAFNAAKAAALTPVLTPAT
jgi:hypothetical protein